MFTLSREALAAALDEIEKSPAKHYNVECPKCRRQVKVPVRNLRRAQPPDTEGSTGKKSS
jgi:hypothetical protein